jgi:hypothetical protein
MLCDPVNRGRHRKTPRRDGFDTAHPQAAKQNRPDASRLGNHWDRGARHTHRERRQIPDKMDTNPSACSDDLDALPRSLPTPRVTDAIEVRPSHHSPSKAPSSECYNSPFPPELL